MQLQLFAVDLRNRLEQWAVATAGNIHIQQVRSADTMTAIYQLEKCVVVYQCVPGWPEANM